MGGTVSSRCAAPPLRSGPSGDTAPPMAKRVATAGRVLPAIAGPACHGERWIAGGRQRLSLVARCDVERDGEQVGPTRPEPVEPHRPARPYPCAGGRARISSGPGSDSPPAQRPDICVHPTPPPRGDTPLQSGADHICGRPVVSCGRSPRTCPHTERRDGTSPSPTIVRSPRICRSPGPAREPFKSLAFDAETPNNTVAVLERKSWRTTLSTC